MMSPDSLPELPVLPSSEEWQRNTAVPLQRRSAALQTIDRTLDAYDDSRETYRQRREEFIRRPSAQTFKEAFNSYTDASEALDYAAHTFHRVSRAFNDWDSRHDSRNQRRAVTDLSLRLQNGQAIIDAGLRSVQAGLDHSGTPIPAQVHLAWLGSVPGADVIKSAEVWAHSQGAKVDIWVDSNNLLASDFKHSTANLRGGQQWDSSNDPAVTARIDLWKNTSAADRDKGLDARWAAVSKPAQDLWAQKWQQFQQLRADLGQGNIRLRDVNELFAPRNPPQHQGTLSPNDRAGLKEAYQREVSQRCNFAAAANVVRLVALHDKPGLYVDTDITPPVRGFKPMVEAWNRALTESYNRADPRNPLPTQPVDVPKLTRRWRETGANPPQRPIDPTIGMHQLNSPAYSRLIAAVEEHTELVRKGIHQIVPNAHRPAYQALAAHAETIDATNQVTRAFDAWSRKANSLGDVYERIRPIHVEPMLFKAFQQTVVGTAGNNQIIATSTPGAYAVAEWGREVGGATRAAVRTPEAMRSYFNELDPNYRHQTIATTGPGHLNTTSSLSQKLTRELGISDRRSPLIMIPYSAFPHPSSAERNASWLPQRPTCSPPGPQQHPGRSASKPGASSSTRPQQCAGPSCQSGESSQSQTHAQSSGRGGRGAAHD